MNNYFITGTDTGVGKTIVSAILTLSLNASYWKPIQSGVADEISDHDCVQQLTQLNPSHFIPSTYTFKASLSPDQAAILENQTINLGNINLPQRKDRLIIEGAGGVYVPLNDDFCMLDLMKKLTAKIVIIARGTLGTINHTLLTINVLRQHGLPIHGIIFNGELNEKNKISIERWGDVKTLLHVPFLKDISATHLQAWTIKNKKMITENFL